VSKSYVTLEDAGSNMVLTCPHADQVIDLYYYIRPQYQASLVDDGTIIFATPHKNEVRSVVRELFGVGDPIPVLIFLDEYLRDGDNYLDIPVARLWLRGRLLAIRESYDDDDEVQLGDGVRVIAGGFTEIGGTDRSPRLNFHRGTVLEVDGVSLFSGHHFNTQGVISISQAVAYIDSYLEEANEINAHVKAMHDLIGYCVKASQDSI
jgi:hypothetical protein